MRRAQLIPVNQVFPTLTVVGWYTIGAAPTGKDVAIHEQVRFLA